MKELYQIAKRSSKTISPSKQIEIIRLLSKVYKIPVKFYVKRKQQGAGLCVRNSKGKLSIHIKLSNLKKYDYLSTFFHELGHVYCHKFNKWTAYHRVNLSGSPKSQVKALRTFIRVAYRAEVWVDLWGCNELKKWFPELPYSFGYYGVEQSKQWFEDNYLKQFRKMLKSLTK